MTMRPRATSSRMSSGARSSRRATNAISSVTILCRADSSWVIATSRLSALGWLTEPFVCEVQHEIPKAGDSVDQEERKYRDAKVDDEQAESGENIGVGKPVNENPHGQWDIGQEDHHVHDAGRELSLDQPVIQDDGGDGGQGDEKGPARSTWPPQFVGVDRFLLGDVVDLVGQAKQADIEGP